MTKKKIVININDKGDINAETFNYQGVSCLEELDKILRDLVNQVETNKKPEYFQEGQQNNPNIINKNGK